MHTTSTTARSAVSVGRRTLGVGLAATVLAAGAYAYTASNTIDASRAGDGVAGITGYTVTGVQYTLDAIDPTQISAVDFTLNGTASTVKAKVESASTTWTTCSSTDSITFTCPVTSSVAAADELAVVAAS